MISTQTDLFATGVPTATIPGPGAGAVSEEVAAIIRARLRAVLTLVEGASSMPWTDVLVIVREDNAFRSGTQALPPQEGAALWAAFDAQMDRLYATITTGLEP